MFGYRLFVLVLIIYAVSCSVNVNNCGKSFGCFLSPEGCNGTNCAVIITYALAPNMPDYLDVSMHTTRQWVALGHNSQPLMAGMKGVLCWNNNGMVMVRSFNASMRSTPMMADIMNGTTVTNMSYMSNKLYCSYRRKLAVPSGSGDYMFDLTTNSYPMWAAGPLNAQGGIARHDIRIAPPMILDVRFQPNITEITTTTSTTSTTSTASTTTTTKMATIPPIMVNNCGKSFGCFLSPEGCNGANCAVIITYALAPNMPDYLDVSMHTTRQWVALGHNSQPLMAGMKGVLCWNNNGMVMVRSFSASGRSTPMMADIVNGTTVTNMLYMNNKLYCSYRRKLAVPSGSGDYMFDLTTNSYPMWAAGPLNAQGGIDQHDIRIAPPMILDVRFQPNTTKAASATTVPQKLLLSSSIIITILIHLCR